VGSIEFGVKVLTSIDQSLLPNQDDVASAVVAALTTAGYPEGDGLSTAEPVQSVKGKVKDGRRRMQFDTGAPLEFTMTLVAFGPMVQKISEVVRVLDFREDVSKALLAAGKASVYRTQGNTHPDAVVVTPAEGTPIPATFYLVSAPPSAPPPRGGTTTPPINGGGSDQTANDEELNGGIIFLIVLLVLCCLWPLFCVVFAIVRFGPGKERLWFKYIFSHSNPVFPFFYIPQEDRDKMREELKSKKKKKDAAVALKEDDDEHI
jgi:hypothetical protein